MKTKWFAVYLFYPGDLDLMLNQLVQPFIHDFFKEESAGTYFFIRYWENGSHLRLRMNVHPKKQESLAAEIKKRAADFFVRYPDLIRAQDLAAAAAVPPGHQVVYASYEPEITRYGNLQSIPWAEAHFFRSSAFVLDWISSRKTGASVLVQALSMHLILLNATGWKFSRLLQVCDTFINGWLPRLYDPNEDPVQESAFWLNQFELSFRPAKTQLLGASKIFWESMIQDVSSDKISCFLHENKLIMKSYLSAGFEEGKLTEIVTSMMHMNNNRLGISNYEEAYGAYCLRQSLDFIAHS
jgi:thiopeptide-type bacteriocin biosynthesis protein